jgi:hypothetical protein
VLIQRCKISSLAMSVAFSSSICFWRGEISSSSK